MARRKFRQPASRTRHGTLFSGVPDHARPADLARGADDARARRRRHLPRTQGQALEPREHRAGDRRARQHGRRRHRLRRQRQPARRGRWTTPRPCATSWSASAARTSPRALPLHRHHLVRQRACASSRSTSRAKRRPYRTRDGRFFLRVGAEKREATREELSALLDEARPLRLRERRGGRRERRGH